MPEFLDYELLVSGRFNEVLQQLIEMARRRVYLATYVAAASRPMHPVYFALSGKAREGVDVKLLLNGASGEALKYNRETAKLLQDLGFTWYRLSDRFVHVKLYIVDDYLILGSHNLSAPSPNRFDVSLMVRSREAADRMAEFFRKLYSGAELGTEIHRGHVGSISYEIYTNTSVLSKLTDLVAFAEERIYVIMYIATVSAVTRRIYRLMAQKLEEGVDVSILLDGGAKLARRYNAETLKHLRKLGIWRSSLSRRYIHAKLVVVDDTVMIGSHNLTSSSVAGRAEVSFFVESPHLADLATNIFEHLWQVDVLGREPGIRLF